MSLSTQYPVETLETTGCVRLMEEVTRTHMFSIVGYSLDENLGKHKFHESTIFNVGGHHWSILYYPNGCTEAEEDDISILLRLKSTSKCVRAQASFTIVDQSGCPLPLSKTTQIRNFKTDCYSYGCVGYTSFVKRDVLESNIKDDCFVIKCVLTVFKCVVSDFKAFPVEPTAQIVVPAGNIQQQLGDLLENGNGVDITFEVDGQTVSAHKCILATRSPVFAAQFFGLTMEKSDTKIKIEEMEAPVFKALLHFIYTDSFPGFEEKKESDEKHDTKLMAERLLVAADRYGLEILKIKCEKMLCGSIDMSNVVTLLTLAERHSCNDLKAICLKFLDSPGIHQWVAVEISNWMPSINLKGASVKRQYGFVLPVAIILFLFLFTLILVAIISKQHGSNLWYLLTV